MLRSLGRRGQSVVSKEVFALHHGAKAFPLALRFGDEIQPSFVSLEEPVQGVQPILPAVGNRRRCFALVSQEIILSEHSTRVQQVAVYLLRDSCALPRVKRHYRPQRDHAAGRKVGRRKLREKHRRIAAPTLSELQAHPSLRQRINPGTMSIRSRPAKSRRVRLNQSRIESFQIFGAEAHAISRARPHVRQHYVRFRRYLLSYFLPFRRLRVCRHGAFIGVQIEEILHPRRPRYVAVWRLELDDVRTEVSQALAAGRPSNHIRHLHNAHAVKRWSVITRLPFARLGQLQFCYL